MTLTGKLSPHSLLSALLTLTATLLMAACSTAPKHQNAIEENDYFVVTADSVIQGSHVAVAVDDRHIVTNHPAASTPRWEAASSHHGNYPTFSSQQHLLNAVYNMSIDEIDRQLNAHTAGHDEELVGQGCWPISSALCLLAPQQSMEMLRALTHDGIITTHSRWPARSGHLLWAAAAWEVYCATGDRNWLMEAHRVLLASLEREDGIAMDEHHPEARGYAPYRSAIAPPPEWSSEPQLMEMTTLASNAILLQAYRVAEAMGDELNLVNDYADKADRLRDAVNHTLWNENHGYYAAWASGITGHYQAPFTDNLAQALAVITGMADDDRAETLIGKTPCPPYGIPLRYPQVEGDSSLTRAAFPLTAAYYALAAARTGNTHAARVSIATLLRTQAFAASCDAWSDAYTGEINRGRLALCNAAATASVALRMFGGIHLMPDGIELSPCIPAAFDGDKVISGLRYRHATLTITVKGVGSEVSSVALDGAPIEGNFVKATDLQSGSHNIVVTMTGESNAGLVTTAVAPWRVLPAAPQAQWNDTALVLPPLTTHQTYRLVVNGYPANYINDTITHLNDTTALKEFAVIALNKHGASDLSSPWLLAPPASRVQADSVSVNADGALVAVITLAAPGEHLVWLHTQHDDTPTPLHSPHLLRVTVNTHPQGAFLLVDEARRSNTLLLRLIKGKNTILLTPIDKNPWNEAPPGMTLLKM